MKHFLLAITAIFFGITLTFGQDLEKNWQFEAVKNDSGVSLYTIQASDEFQLKDGEFNYAIKAIDTLGDFSGNYMFQNNLLVLYYDVPSEKIERYKISELTDSTLVFSNKLKHFSFKTVTEVAAITTIDEDLTGSIVPSQGFSFNSLWRGILGMMTLICIAFLFSSNRKAIKWKTVAIGIALQLIIAVGVLKVDFVKVIFEWIGQRFIDLLGFTQAGSEFLFGGMLNVESFGFIFAFQVLPTIIFFSALTSVLFYLGLIQKVVKGMGWLLSKALGISGAESLSVAGNIFLGQTEAPLLIKAYLEKIISLKSF